MPFGPRHPVRYVGRDVVGGPSGRTSRLRSALHLGFPAPGVFDMPRGKQPEKDERKDTDWERDVYQPFWAELQQRFYTYFGMDSWSDDSAIDGLVVVFFSQALAGSDFFERMITADLMWAMGSILFVLCVLIYHTGSAFLGGLGMLQILFSLPCTLFVYRIIFGITFLTQMHVLSIFLVLGIGADDLFVFYDAWLQSQHLVPKHAAGAMEGDSDGVTVTQQRYIARMDYTYKRAAKAMLTTSFTTCVAFLATAASPLMPLSAFGIFAAVAVIANYAMVMTVWYASLVDVLLRLPRNHAQVCLSTSCILTNAYALRPCLVFIWERTGRLRCCCCWGSGFTPEVLTADETEPGLSQNAEILSLTPKQAKVVPIHEMQGEQEPDLRCLERCFVTHYVPLIRTKWRIVSVIVFFVYFTMAGYFALQLEPPTKQEKWFPESHMVQRLQDGEITFRAV